MGRIDMISRSTSLQSLVGFPDSSRLVVGGIDEGASSQIRRLFVIQPDGEIEREMDAPDSLDYAEWSPNGKALAFAAGQIFVIDIQSGKGRAVAQSNDAGNQLDWSHDGSRLAYTAIGSFHSFDIFIIDASGGDPLQLTSSPSPEFAPIFSPDDGSIAFRRSGDNHDDLVVTNLHTMEERVLFDRPAGGGSVSDLPAWSPDGARLAFRALVTGETGIYVVDADGSHLEWLVSTSTDIRELCWLSENRIAFTSLYAGL